MIPKVGCVRFSAPLTVFSEAVSRRPASSVKLKVTPTSPGMFPGDVRHTFKRP